MHDIEGTFSRGVVSFGAGWLLLCTLKYRTSTKMHIMEAETEVEKEKEMNPFAYGSFLLLR